MTGSGSTPHGALPAGAGRAGQLLLAALAAWLALAVLLVHMELDDGYTTIVNSQHFLGISEGYFWQRGPLMAWLLVPAEWLANRLGLAPFSVWPHHASMALLHFAYLVCVWRLLRAHFGAHPATLLGYAAAMASPLFFSYAPFISHDLLPGALLLGMLWVAQDDADEPRPWRWWLLFALGSAALLVKQTYLLFWPAVLVAQALTLQAGPLRGRIALRRLLRWSAAACLSGAFGWIVYCWVLRTSFPDAPFLLAPLQQIQGVVENVARGGDPAQTFDPWLYLRNLPAIGITAVLLAATGALLCLRGPCARSRSIALAWLALLLVMQLLPVKEVRYLGFLAPLGAYLAVAALHALWQSRRRHALWLLLPLAFDLQAAAQEALRIRKPYFSHEVHEFLSQFPPAQALPNRTALLMPLSFIEPGARAFRNDRFHRITHVVADQILLLNGYASGQVLQLENEAMLAEPWIGPGSTVVLSNLVLTRRPPFRADNQPADIERFWQVIATAQTIHLQRQGDDYQGVPADSHQFLLVRAAASSATPLLLVDRIAVADLLRLRQLDTAPERLELLALRIEMACDSEGCRRPR